MQKDSYTAKNIKVELLRSGKGWAELRVFWDDVAYTDFFLNKEDLLYIDPTLKITYSIA